jgi:hypothetical protein
MVRLRPVQTVLGCRAYLSHHGKVKATSGGIVMIAAELQLRLYKVRAYIFSLIVRMALMLQ